MTPDLIVVGAGLSGAVMAERAASQLDWRVLVVEKRGHIAGNAYDEHDEHGVLVHRYGPHIFHTNSEKIWRYMSTFTRWRAYEHRVCGMVEGKLVPVPFNLRSIDLLFERGRAQELKDSLTAEFAFGSEVPILQLRKSSSTHVRWLADYVYENIFLGYTLKQWGLRPEELDASVTARVPMRVNYDDRYFIDRYQALPADGYTTMVRRMLTHPNIEVATGIDFHQMDATPGKALVYTGSIDRFFEYRHGALPYRSLRFEFAHDAADRIQATGSINYPNDHGYTRRCEFKILTGQVVSGTSVAFEYPQAFRVGQNEAYYPIPQRENRERHDRYLELASSDSETVFCGRLADYQYLNMDQAVARALHVFETALAGGRVVPPNAP